MNTRLFTLAIAAILIASVAISVNAQTSATVKVKCSSGQSINTALKQHPNAKSLIVEIEGMCSENVIVTRDNVTLRGTSPASDGIQAIASTTPTDVGLWVRGAHQVNIENLKLTGGFAGLLATEVSTTNLEIVNCRLEGNRAHGALLEYALIEAEDTVFASNGNVNAGVFSSRLACTRCTFSDPLGNGALGTRRENVLAQRSTVLLFESELANGAINLLQTFLGITDSTISAHAPDASVFGSQSIFNLTRVQVTGPMRFNQSSNAVLLGVTQSGSGPNVVDENAFVRIGNASPVTGGPPSIPSNVLGFVLRNFSNFSLTQTSQISGNLNCAAGGNAFCTTPANVSGTSNCALCPKP